MALPPGVPDPLFLHELAESLHMTVAELCYGRGTPPSAHELTVLWPLYFDYKRREAERQANKQEAQRTFV
jgi:hypothetical protein